jgi:hypothetical protein
MRREQHQQRDLFESLETIAVPPPALQAKLAPLLQALLTEAAGIKRVGYGDKEIGDDQDHA